MNKNNIIVTDKLQELYNSVASGGGMERNKYLTTIRRGKIAIDLWDDARFTLGMEYGVLWAVREMETLLGILPGNDEQC